MKRYLYLILVLLLITSSCGKNPNEKCINDGSLKKEILCISKVYPIDISAIRTRNKNSKIYTVYNVKLYTNDTSVSYNYCLDPSYINVDSLSKTNFIKNLSNFYKLKNKEKIFNEINKYIAFMEKNKVTKIKIKNDQVIYQLYCEDREVLN